MTKIAEGASAAETLAAARGLLTLAAATTVSVTVEDNEETAGEEAVIEWEADVAPEGVATDDGRFMVPGSLSWREPPLTLMVLTETSEGGHAGAEAAGSAKKVWKDENIVRASGVFDSGEIGQETARMVEEGTLTGVSMDLAIQKYGFRDPETGDILLPEDMSDEEWMDAMFGDLQFAVLEGVIGAMTVVPFAAFPDTRISLTADGQLTMSIYAPLRLPGLVAGEGITASAPIVRSKEVYGRPEADGPTPLTLTEDGEIYGHAFLWETCHTGFSDRCVTAPHSPSDYAYFHLGAVDTTEGEEVAVGQITLDTGHADLRAGRNATRRHYDDTGVAAADVRLVDGQYGGWLSGALRDVPEEDARKLKAAKLSGDWRSVNGTLDLIGLLAVNVPGFPVPRPEARLVSSAEGEEVCALVAAGIQVAEDEWDALLAALGVEDEMTVLITALCSE